MDLINEEELTEIVTRCKKIRDTLDSARQVIEHYLGQLEYLTRVIDFRMAYRNEGEDE